MVKRQRRREEKLRSADPAAGDTSVHTYSLPSRHPALGRFHHRNEPVVHHARTLGHPVGTTTHLERPHQLCPAVALSVSLAKTVADTRANERGWLKSVSRLTSRMSSQLGQPPARKSAGVWRMEHTRHARRSDFLPPPRGGMTRGTRMGVGCVCGLRGCAWPASDGAEGLCGRSERLGAADGQRSGMV